jgi:hypothetical protein
MSEQVKRRWGEKVCIDEEEGREEEDTEDEEPE